MVYRGHDLDLDRIVAIKILPLSLDQGSKRERFLREARVAASIGHPHVVKVFDAGFFDEERPFLVMELLKGMSLHRWLHEMGPLAIEDACVLGSQMCSALDAMHRSGIVHRDLKPGNVFLLEGLGVTCKLIDFGMSKSFVDERKQITEKGRVIGTPSYMAPEQLLGAKPGPRADVYGVGCVLYETLVGKPYVKRHKRIEKTFQEVLQRKPAPPSADRPSIPAAVDTLVLHAVAREPEERFASCADLKRACDEALAQLQRGIG